MLIEVPPSVRVRAFADILIPSLPPHKFPAGQVITVPFGHLKGPVKTSAYGCLLRLEAANQIELDPAEESVDDGKTPKTDTELLPVINETLTKSEVAKDEKPPVIEEKPPITEEEKPPITPEVTPQVAPQVAPKRGKKQLF